MNKNGFSISEFSKITHIPDATLRYYDEIGLLSPMQRGENNYRYYSIDQIAIVNLIRTLKELGITLSEIKAIKDLRNPKRIETILTQKIKKINEKRENLLISEKLLNSVKNDIQSTFDIDEKSISIQFIYEEKIIRSDQNDYSGGKNDYDALFDFYNVILKKYKYLGLGYPIWAIYSGDRIKQGDWHYPDYYYFYNAEGLDTRPAGIYVIGYKRGGYGQNDDLYKRLINYINENGYEICGDAYEEYPLNEICIIDKNDYLIRIMIQVHKKEM